MKNGSKSVEVVNSFQNLKNCLLSNSQTCNFFNFKIVYFFPKISDYLDKRDLIKLKRILNLDDFRINSLKVKLKNTPEINNSSEGGNENTFKESINQM